MDFAGDVGLEVPQSSELGRAVVAPAVIVGLCVGMPPRREITMRCRAAWPVGGHPVAPMTVLLPTISAARGRNYSRVADSTERPPAGG